MASDKKALIFILLSLNIPSLWALDYGFKVNTGISGGAGQEWNQMLDDSGNRDFADVLGTFGVGVFAEMNVSPVNIFTPELYYVVNRGVQLSNSRDDYFKIASIHSLELILPIARDFPFSGGDKAFRLMGGFQILYSFNLVETSRINDMEDRNEQKNKTPLSLGFVLGTGLEFKRMEKRSYIGDFRIKLPFTDSLSYSAADGSPISLKTVELLLGGGIKF